MGLKIDFEFFDVGHLSDLGKKNSLVIYDQKFRLFKFAVPTSCRILLLNIFKKSALILFSKSLCSLKGTSKVLKCGNTINSFSKAVV